MHIPENTIPFQLRYLREIHDNRIYLTRHTEAWLQRRHQVCFGIAFEYRAQWYVNDLGYLHSLVHMMRETA